MGTRTDECHTSPLTNVALGEVQGGLGFSAQGRREYPHKRALHFGSKCCDPVVLPIKMEQSLESVHSESLNYGCLTGQWSSFD